MKIFLGINNTDKNKPSVYKGEDFVAKTISQQSQQALDENDEQIEQIQTRASLPKGLKIAFYVFLAVFAVVAVGIIRAVAKGTPIDVGYQNAPWLFWIAGGSGVVALGLYLFERYLVSKVAEDKNTESIFLQQEALIEKAIDELDLPDDKQPIDFYALNYSDKNGKIAIKKYDMYANMIPVSLMAYRKDEKVCLADITQILEISADKFTKITKINKSAFVRGWTKDESIKSPKYAQYKIKIVQGGLLVKPYYYLTLVHKDEEIRMYFPCYELPVIQQLTGIDKVEEEK